MSAGFDRMNATNPEHSSPLHYLDLGWWRRRKISLAEIPKYCTRRMSTPNAQTILKEVEGIRQHTEREITTLEQKLLGRMEAEESAKRYNDAQIIALRASAKQQSKNLTDLIIDTPDGKTTVDELYSRLTDVSFLAQRKRRRPCFAAFRSNNPTCEIALDLTSYPWNMIVGATSSPSRLQGEAITHQRGWIQFFIITMMLVPTGFAAILLVACGAALFNVIDKKLFDNGTLLGVIISEMAMFIWLIRKKDFTIRLGARFPCFVPPNIGSLIASLQQQFDEVNLIAEVDDWLEPGSVHSSRLPSTDFLVIVSRGEYHWLAAAVIAQKKSTKAPVDELADF